MQERLHVDRSTLTIGLQSFHCGVMTNPISMLEAVGQRLLTATEIRMNGVVELALEDRW